MKVSIDKAKSTFTVTLPLTEKVSGSGKSILLASTHGAKACADEHKGESIVVSVNAYIPNADYVKPTAAEKAAAAQDAARVAAERAEVLAKKVA